MSADTAVRRYSDPKHGIVLEYPTDWRMMEGSLDNAYGLGYLGPIPMAFAAAGGVRLITVSAPDDSYPGTDFGTAFVTISQDGDLTKSQCQHFSMDFSSASKPIPGVTKISGIDFKGVMLAMGGLGHQFEAMYYHGFSEGACYEVGTGLATAGYGAVQGLKPVNRHNVFARLNSIVRTVVIRNPESQ
jgi:hypothetical protein